MAMKLLRVPTIISVALSSLLLCLPALGGRAAAETEHCDHQKVVDRAALVRSTSAYRIPDVVLIDQDAERVELQALLSSDKTVMLNFIFATCTTICPVLSAGFAQFRENLGTHAADVQFVSVTIDPEHDTAEVLKKYSRRFDAGRDGENWIFLTGSRTNVDQVAKAFGAYVPDKMNHRPATYIRAKGSETWVKLDGFMGISDYETEYVHVTHD
jgi:protein SCO1/2